MNFFSFVFRGAPVWIPDLPDHIPTWIRRLGRFYEADLLLHLERVVPKGGVWVDVGANIGNHTIFFSRYTSDSVVSLEPHPDTFDVLKATLNENNANNVIALSVGAADTAKNAKLALPDGLRENAGAYRVTDEGPVEVRLEKLDDVLHTYRPVRVIKIDIEGYELQALKGAATVLRDDRPHLVVEAHTQGDFHALRRLLAPMGYKWVARTGWSHTYHFACWSWPKTLRVRCESFIRRAANT